MRIWIVNHYADPPTGMATRTYDIGRRWVQAGHPTTVFVSNFSHYTFSYLRPMKAFRWWLEEDVDGVRMVWIQATRYRRNDLWRVVNMASFSLLALLAGAVRRERPQVVIGVSVHPLAALSGYYLARLKGARFLFEVTDLWPQSLVDLGQLRADSPVTRWMRRLERFLYRKAERIVMLWRDTGDYVESLGVPATKIIWIPHGVELERYRDLEPYDGAPRPPFRVVYMGGFVKSMSLETILDAAQILQEKGVKDIEFELVGAGTYREQLMQRARALNLRNLSFPPAVPKKEIARVMSRADAFIYGLHDLPLYRYGMSLNKLSDYLAGGRPIIYYGRSSYDPVSAAGAGFTVPPGDPAAVADAPRRCFRFIRPRSTPGSNAPRR